LRKLCLKVDYAEEQCVSVYGIIHIHVWMYRF
jgi:ribosomal protein S3